MALPYDDVYINPDEYCTKVDPINPEYDYSWVIDRWRPSTRYTNVTWSSIGPPVLPSCEVHTDCPLPQGWFREYGDYGCGEIDSGYDSQIEEWYLEYEYYNYYNSYKVCSYHARPESSEPPVCEEGYDLVFYPEETFTAETFYDTYSYGSERIDCLGIGGKWSYVVPGPKYVYTESIYSSGGVVEAYDTELELWKWSHHIDVVNTRIKVTYICGVCEDEDVYFPEKDSRLNYSVVVSELDTEALIDLRQLCSENAGNLQEAYINCIRLYRCEWSNDYIWVPDPDNPGNGDWIPPEDLVPDGPWIPNDDDNPDFPGVGISLDDYTSCCDFVPKNFIGWSYGDGMQILVPPNKR